MGSSQTKDPSLENKRTEHQKNSDAATVNRTVAVQDAEPQVAANLEEASLANGGKRIKFGRTLSNRRLVVDDLDKVNPAPSAVTPAEWNVAFGQEAKQCQRGGATERYRPRKQKEQHEDTQRVSPLEAATVAGAGSGTIANMTGELTALANALALLEQHGAAPVLPDGKVGGNGAVVWSFQRGTDATTGSVRSLGICVSPSGKDSGTVLRLADFVLVDSFDEAKWHATYRSRLEDLAPTSDTPLLWHALRTAPQALGWKQWPRVALHGHGVHSEEAAEALGVPISPLETLFSTREDTAALSSLLSEHSYPEHQIFLRKGHGFFILAATVEDAVDVFEKRLLPYLRKQNTDNVADDVESTTQQ